MGKSGSAYGYPSKVEAVAVDASDSDYEQDQYNVKGGLNEYGSKLKAAFNDQSPNAKVSYSASSALGSGRLYDLAQDLAANSGRYPTNRTVSCSVSNDTNMRLARLTMLLGCSRSELASKLLAAALEDVDTSIDPI
jgi:hypothetical protein